MHLPGSVAFRQIVVGILEERGEEKEGKFAGITSAFSLVQSAGVV